MLICYLQKKGSVTQKTKSLTGEEIRAGITTIERYRGGVPVYGGLNDPRMGTNSRDAKFRCKTCDCTYSGSGSNMDDCPGHFGHIELCRPVYHPGFINDVLKILHCVCFQCSRLLIDEKDPKDLAVLSIKDPEIRLKAFHLRCKRAHVKCMTGEQNDLNQYVNEITGLKKQQEESVNDMMRTDDYVDGNVVTDDVKKETSFVSTIKPPCGATRPNFKREGVQIIVRFTDDSDAIGGNGRREQKLSAQKVYDIFKRISDEDVVRLGLNPKWARPEWMLVSVLPVPPPHVRPTVMEGDMMSEDDLTFQLQNILKANITLEEKIANGLATHHIEDFEFLLQQKVTSFFDNERDDNPRETQKSGRPLKTIRQRLRGKEGRLRGNLMGKRVDFSARTVITADPNLSIDQVGVPKSVALKLTVPVVVTPFNINQLRQLVANGPLEWPGATYIIRSDQSQQNLKYVSSKSEIVLEYGWIVERHLRDDDIVLFNRQPSLHKMSIMGHRAKILDWSTFRLNLSVTTPYNADFDGDEMNLHVPQSITAQADADQLMMVPRNIITPQSNRNVMGIVQDALLGVSRMTRRDVFIEKDVFMNAMLWIATWDGVLPTPAILKPRPLWTGKQLFSMVCPKISWKGKSKCHVDEKKITDPFNYQDTMVLIHSGELIHGIVDKNVVGASGGSVIHVTWLEKGWEETRNFMNQIQTAVNYWFVNTSYSIGVSDTVADANTINNIQATLNEAKEKVKNIMIKGQLGELELMPGMPLMDSFEMHINEVLNDTRSTVGKSAQQSLNYRNAIKGTVTCGSKGSELNISQIIACVGQQNVQGKRIRYGFRQRTLPHFAKDDLGMESRGFVENSYLRGLSPQEFYFHAMCGREGIIDTAVKTADVGYIQRRLVKAMETVMARYDTTLRNANGCVMQFLYGEDGMDAQRIEKQVFDTYSYTQSEFRNAYYLDISAENFGQLNYYLARTNSLAYFMHPDIVEDCRNDIEVRALLDEEYEQLLIDRVQLREIMGCRGAGSESDPSTYLPVNIDRLIWNAQRQFRVNLLQPSMLHPREIVESVRSMTDELIVVRGDDPISREAQQNATLLFQILVRSKLASKKVLREYRLSKEALEWIIFSITYEFRAAVVGPGEMCGVMAAQSIGQPATQMTLNTFHNTGISAKNVTLGVPRLNEILNVGKNIKTPSLFINLKVRDDKRVALSVMSQIEYTRLGDITVKTEIHYDPDPRDTVIEDDEELVQSAAEFLEVDANPDHMSPWVLRIVLDNKFINPRVVEDPNFSLADIANKITEYFNNGVHVLHSDINSTTGYVLRIRILNEDIQTAEDGGEKNGAEDYDLLRRMQKTLLDNLHLFGIAGIKKVYFSQKKNVSKWSDEKGFEPVKEWVLETDGSNLAEVMTVPSIDHTSTVSNDILEMFQVLGIEAARASLFNELRNVLSFDGEYVNYRHIACLADCMTFGGYIMAASRHGINKSEGGPMLRASFEETVEVFMNAATFSQYDVFNGVTENVMLGQLGKLGSGFVDLLLDQEKLNSAIDTIGASGALTLSSIDIGQDGPSQTPIGSYTPYQSTPSSGYLGGSATPTMGAFTPASYTPAYGDATPGHGYTSPYYGGGSSPAYANPSGYVTMSPSMSLSSPGYGINSPKYSPTRYDSISVNGYSV